MARPFEWDGGGISFGDPAVFGPYRGLHLDQPATWGPVHAWVHWFNTGYPAQAIMNKRIVFGIAVTEDQPDGTATDPGLPTTSPGNPWFWWAVAFPHWTGDPAAGAQSGVRFLPDEQVHANVFRRMDGPASFWLSWSMIGVQPDFTVGFGFDFRVGLRLFA